MRSEPQPQPQTNILKGAVMYRILRTLSLLVIIPIFLFIYSCNKTDAPVLTTHEIDDVDYRSASGGGHISDDGGDPVLSRGLCWNKTGNPTIEDSIAKCGSGTGAFHKSLSNLTPGTSYYVRAYATNSSKTGYGNEVSFRTRTIFIPVLSTYCITFSNQTTVKTGGMVHEYNGGTISERGVCWSTSPSPDINSEKKASENPEGYNFYITVTNLAPGTTYYLRSYATNEAGTGYGNELIFTVHVDGATISDIEGNVYKTVKIGTQTWMAENLRATSFNNGFPLQNVTNDYSDANLSAYAWYNNNEAESRAEYGALYNYNAVAIYKTLYESNVCPAGWHVPSNNEWSTLISYLGGERFAGGKLKEKGAIHWANPNAEATDEFGFGALPGGHTNFSHGFYSQRITGSWWSSDFGYYNGQYYTMLYVMDALSGSVVPLPGNTHFGYSVRCIRDY